MTSTSDPTETPVDKAKPLIAILDYGIGNLHSALTGFQAVGADARLTSDPALIAQAAGVVLPGVGAFAPCMAALRSTGLDQVCHETVDAGIPFFGICIGMQLLQKSSEEAPGVAGLGILDGEVRRLPTGVKHPQMQWNRLLVSIETPMTTGLGEDPWMYFVHSFAAVGDVDCVATCDYGGPVAAASVRDNLWAAQFHPEKSGPTGLAVLRNFVGVAAAAGTDNDVDRRAGAPS